MSTKRLIETAFPLAEASAASLHEKNVRHGHISTLHLWPARRPLAASRAAIAAALLIDPSTDAERIKLVRRLGGKLVPKKQAKSENGTNVDVEKVTGEGGILWWGQENTPDLEWFRHEIRNSNGGRAPRVLDPFAGGGAIPLEAMRLGCEVTASDLNPVAWLLLKCTLEYPQKLGGERRPLPKFVLSDRGFMESFLKSLGMKPGAVMQEALARAAGDANCPTDLFDDAARPWLSADLGWHIRAWGQYVLAQATRELGDRYPTYAAWTSLHPDGKCDAREIELVHLDANGQASVAKLNATIAPADLADPRTPRWVSKPTVAYLWARTVRCKSCRATVPLLKTGWLCRTKGKRVRLTMEPTDVRDGVTFGVETGVPVQGNTVSARNAFDKALGAGTMSRTGAKCPCCGAINASEDIRYEGTAGRLGQVLTAVIVDGLNGKEYRNATDHEIARSFVTDEDLKRAFDAIPFGRPTELIPIGGSRNGGGSPFTVPLYGLKTWDSIFTSRQLLTLATFTRIVRQVKAEAIKLGYPDDWATALWAYLALANDRVADRSSTIAHWDVSRENIANTFSGFRLPMTWDFVESSSTGECTGSYSGAVEWIGRVVSQTVNGLGVPPNVKVVRGSAMQIDGIYDAIITDPPYYDAIPYSDLMDFFYVWLRRALHGMSDEVDSAFETPLGPKWSHKDNDGELIDDSSRFGGDKSASKKNFEDGMASVFKRCADSLTPEGVLVVVFANKNPDAWETLVGALIRAGFVVDGSLPIQTEMGNRTRAQSSAALSSSVWLVCRKRSTTARVGFSGRVLEQMGENVRLQMNRFWDAGVRGPDFVWAATGPALEAYSRHPVVFREASTSGEKERMPVSEFLREVRRIVVEFAVGRVLNVTQISESKNNTSLDNVTTYYVLHRDTFGMADAPVGSCILYAMSCGLSDRDLTDRMEILVKGGTRTADIHAKGEADDLTESEELDADTATTGSGGNVRLQRWDQRKRKNLGLEGFGGSSAPLIDRVHRAMQLWKAGDLAKVNAFFEQSSTGRDPVFAQLVQAIIELSRRDSSSEEATILESISNHLQSRAGISATAQEILSL